MKTKRLAFAAAVLICSAAVFAQSAAVMEQIETDMVYVPGGTFLMGSKEYESNESPVRQVTVNGFYVSKYEVKQSAYRNVMGRNYSSFRGNDRPVEEVSWYDAVVFCNKLSMASGLTCCYSLNGVTDPDLWGGIPRITDENLDLQNAWNEIACNFEADGYRLPTEAEWEYAAQAGESFLYSGNDSAEAVAWFEANSGRETHDCGSKAPNAYGLYDMSGNVWEWCWDWYNGCYDSEDVVNPKGNDSAATGRRIRRGGSVKSQEQFLRSANRASSVPSLRGVDLGFRLVRSAETEEQAAEGEVHGAIDIIESVVEVVTEIKESAEITAENEEVPSETEEVAVETETEDAETAETETEEAETSEITAEDEDVAAETEAEEAETSETDAETAETETVEAETSETETVTAENVETEAAENTETEAAENTENIETEAVETTESAETEAGTIEVEPAAAAEEAETSESAETETSYSWDFEDIVPDFED